MLSKKKQAVVAFLFVSREGRFPAGGSGVPALPQAASRGNETVNVDPASGLDCTETRPL